MTQNWFHDTENYKTYVVIYFSDFNFVFGSNFICVNALRKPLLLENPE